MYRYGQKKRTRRIYILYIFAFILVVIAIYVNFRNYNTNSIEEKYANPKELVENNNEKKVVEDNKNLDDEEEVAAVTSHENRITPTTEIVYQYFYEADGKLVEEKEFPPFYLINMDEDKLKSKFNEWKVISFSDKKVVMRKIVKEKSPFYYIIGEKDGSVAVFYENPVNGIRLREITDTPISSLPEVEQNKLKAGIRIYGEDELINVLEDYSS